MRKKMHFLGHVKFFKTLGGNSGDNMHNSLKCIMTLCL